MILKKKKKSFLMFILSQVWSGQDFKPTKTLAGHEARVTGLDISDGEFCPVTNLYNIPKQFN